MAWEKSITREDNGAVATYWEVISIYYNHRTQKSILAVGGWVSQSAYENSLEPLMTKSWEIPSGLAPELASGAVTFVSTFAQAQAEFQ
jgi:hypothetical protein